ncbi:class I SAM-dependent methyltransferase [Roseateles microcysteis]|uniref:class I SAM-dependent methyltransferase n=1 Tax=Roseateles microcysteis TaxID=3119057 RepID=UPI002FE58ED2
MDPQEYRALPSEQLRTRDLLALMPARGGVALDIGARDGHFSLLLAERFERVIALDLVMPTVQHPRVECVKGNAAQIDLPDNSIDLVFCAEVLEHIPTPLLPQVCSELQRVSRSQLLIGVPYRQDILVGRTSCRACGGSSPPWGHVNAFDEHKLAGLFGGCNVAEMNFVGSNRERTNALSALLMDWAGNPYGTYCQDEPCVHCGQALQGPPPRGLHQKLLTKLAFLTRWPSMATAKPHGNWIHLLLNKNRPAVMAPALAQRETTRTAVAA